MSFSKTLLSGNYVLQPRDKLGCSAYDTETNHYNNGPLRQESNITIDPTLFNFKIYYHILFGSDLRDMF